MKTKSYYKIAAVVIVAALIALLLWLLLRRKKSFAAGEEVKKLVEEHPEQVQKAAGSIVAGSVAVDAAHPADSAGTYPESELPDDDGFWPLSQGSGMGNHADAQPYVKEVQRMLNRNGASLVVDGKWGENTEKAAQNYLATYWNTHTHYGMDGTEHKVDMKTYWLPFVSKGTYAAYYPKPE